MAAASDMLSGTMPGPAKTAGIVRLLDVMARLHDPEGGCPWDVEQTFQTIAPYTIEEAYEVADAIEQGDMAALQEELGDLLLQVVYHARMAEEEGRFDFDAVAAGIADKMVRRHPHVFGGESIDSPEAQTRSWEAQKAAERAAKAGGAGRPACSTAYRPPCPPSPARPSCKNAPPGSASTGRKQLRFSTR